ncbi:MAG: putative ADP-ribosylglycohydrolase [Paracoccaceae bacterium]|nr:MAG: putative ADP-ribosylglycohydrolase [Paracoccaceae bacterium]
MQSFARAWVETGPRVHDCLARGGRVLVHCRGGLGRAGTVAAQILMEQGMAARQAIARIRQARKGAIETPAQEKYLADMAARDHGLVARRIEASLLAGAMGDALGAEIEFWKLAEIRRAYPTGFDGLPPHAGMTGAITDDTQMTLFTAEGLINAHVRYYFKGICHPPSVVHHALLRWYVTQGGKPRREVDDRGLVADPRLHHQRAPGNTCLSALGAAEHFGDMARNDSKGCGTIMRVAPVAFSGVNDVAALAMETSALTHGHVTGQEAAAAWALILRDVFEGKGSPEQAARALLGHFGAETDAALRAALAAPRDGRAETVEGLGGGWVAEEALAIALYACLCAADLEHGLSIAVTHSGDSDSTGAIAGNLLGLMFPDQVFAHRWADEVECRDLIGRLAGDLSACLAGEIEGLEERYPGW